jgi:heme a synthase
MLVALTLILLFIGGLVTTYRVGMAVVDWPTSEGYGLLSTPVDVWTKDLGFRLEHGHRLIGAIVGALTLVVLVIGSRTSGKATFWLTLIGALLELVILGLFFRDLNPPAGSVGAIAEPRWDIFIPGIGASTLILVASLFTGKDRGRRAFMLIVNLAVLVQGVLGGARVILDSSEYGFIHGTVAQGVFALIFGLLVISGNDWNKGARGQGGGVLTTLYVLVTAGAIFSQAQLGAMTRHSGEEKATKFVMMHGGMAIIVVGLVAGLLVVLRRTAEQSPEGDPARKGIMSMRKMIMMTLGAQIVLGTLTLIMILAVTKGFDQPATLGEAIFASTHVIFGALLLGSTFGALLWTGRMTFCKPALGGAA